MAPTQTRLALLVRPDPRPKGPKPRRRTELGLIVFGAALVTAAYVLMSVGTTARLPAGALFFLVVLLGLGLVAHVANRIWAPDANAVLLPIVLLLNGFGYVMIARIDAIGGEGGHLAKLQAAWTAAGVVVYVLTLVVVKRSRDLDRYRYLLLVGGAVLLLLPLGFPKVNGARLWVRVGPLTGQPVEIAKIALCIFFASYFAEKREMLSTPTLRIGNRLVLDPRPLGPIVVAWAFAMLILAGENDVGFTLMIFLVFIAMLWMASGRFVWLFVGLALFALGAFIASHVFGQVNERVTAWLDPWSHPATSGFQIIQSQYSFANGGLVGTGLGYGYWGNLFTGSELATDFIFITFGQELGLLGTSMIAAAFLLIVGAGLQISQRARSDFAKLAAFGLTAILGIQAFIIMAGLLRLLPLTGVTLPFMAYGGSSLVANYVLIALLLRISDEGNRPLVAQEATALVAS